MPNNDNTANLPRALEHIRRYATAVRVDAWTLLDSYMAGTLSTIRTEAITTICNRWGVRASDVFMYMMGE